MKYDPHKHHRRSIRLKGYDYSQAGAYFFTLVTHNRETLFGDIQNGHMTCNPTGTYVWEFWNTLPQRYPNVELDEYIVMPNHIHGIILINASDTVGAIHESPLRSPLPSPLPAPTPQTTDPVQRRKMLLPKIIGYFKMNTAKQINLMRNTEGTTVWQRDYWEHIIRNETELNSIREYISNNPGNWLSDKENKVR